MNLMVTIGPGLAPLVGGGLAGVAGWRAIFILLCGLGLVNFLSAWRLLPETGGAPPGHGARTVVRNYGRLACTPAFLGYAIGGGCATTSMYAFVSAAPFIFTHQLGRPDHEVGVYLAVVVFGIWLGSVAASRLAGRVDLGRMLVRANLLSAAAAMAFLLAALIGRLSVPVVVGSMLLYTFGVGIAGPAALAKAMGVNPLVVGSASGLYGFAQMGIGAICTALATSGDNPALASGIVLAATGVTAQAAFWLAHRASRA
jgi:DHA1 family bicyclomycin/chloramphenicol resistance-like MFS transporter